MMDTLKAKSLFDGLTKEQIKEIQELYKVLDDTNIGYQALLLCIDALEKLLKKAQRFIPR